jgi:hypothetical protein
MLESDKIVVYDLRGFSRMKIRISRHAKRRLKERNIPYNDIVEVVENPEEITPSIKGRLNYHKAIGSKHIKVTCKEESEGMVIITVMDKNL